MALIDGERLLLGGTLLNDVRLNRRASVVVGDRLRLGHPEVEWLLIAVADDHGS